MPYEINKFNGDRITLVNDGTIDNSTSLKLIGKNYAGYGEIQNENFVFLLENFANSSAPPRPLAGQIWYDSANKKLKFYDKANEQWKTTGGAEIGPTPPTGLTTGDFWFNTTTKQLYSWDSSASEFVLIGPQAAGTRITQMRSRIVQDTNIPSGSHAIIEALTNEVTNFIISSDNEFTLDNTLNPIAGFAKVRKGVTLAYTTADSGQNVGVTEPGAAQNTAYRFWGTATNSDKLGGLDASAFINKNNAVFTGKTTFDDTGFVVGAIEKLKVFNDSTNLFTPTFQNIYGDSLVFQTTVNSALVTPLTMKGVNLLPGVSNTTDLGSSDKRFKDVYAAGKFKGTSEQSDSLRVGTDYRTASTASSPDTVVARDSSSNISANLFNGTATSARYADLAEKYLADRSYEVGTVVMVGGNQEVTACQPGKRALGAVSANPAYMMNADLDGGTYIALKGRVPVKVYGMVRKGSELEAGSNGVAVVADLESTKVFAIALETNIDPDVKLVECIIL